MTSMQNNRKTGEGLCKGDVEVCVYVGKALHQRLSHKETEQHNKEGSNVYMA